MARKSNRRRLPVATPTLTSKQLLLERKRRRLLRNTLTLTIVAVLGGAILWSLFQWATAAYWAAMIVRVQKVADTFAVTVPAEGVILRDEQLSIAPEGGSVVLIVYEASPVFAGDHVLTLDNSRVALTIEQQVYELEQRLISYDSSDIARLQNLDQQIQNGEAIVRQKTTQLRDAVQAFDRPLMRQLEEELGQQNTLRLRLVGERAQMPDDPQKLESQIESLRQQLQRVNIEVFAEDEGVLTYWVDGAERSFTMDSYSSLSMDVLQDLAPANDLGHGRDVKAGAPLFKIVNPGPWRWTGFVPLDKWHSPENGLLSFYYDETATSDDASESPREIRLESWVVDDGQTFGDFKRITVEFPQYLTSMLNKRKLTLRYVVRETRGIIVNEENLLEHQGEKGLLVIENGLVRFQRVDIADKDGERIVITSTMGPYEIIANPSAQMIGLKLQ